ncbi:MAG: succinate dehydrogenase, cytochrome b556 subunit [Gammaproteobacteria bacterium]|nr:succinate dehydrogenase, cytochrome b556 subunit [Gammaproteobacteria bacterium]MCF6260199.1 succinate dehydrogenase, cytochrome b556 subunit [Gammaproteobacteria bacterium]
MSTTDSRPVFLNLLRIRQPVMAVVSIFHRISGVLMILALPGLVYLLNLSLSNQAGFSQVADLLASPVLKLLAVLLGWALTHHILAGIRFMLLDFDLGIDRAVARKTAWLVHVGALLLTAVLAGLIFGVLPGMPL